MDKGLSLSFFPWNILPYPKIEPRSATFKVKFFSKLSAAGCETQVFRCGVKNLCLVALFACFWLQSWSQVSPVMHASVITSLLSGFLSLETTALLISVALLLIYFHQMSFILLPYFYTALFI